MNISYQHLNIDQLLIQHYLIKSKSSTHQSSLQSGFTLLEMVLVLFLVGLMASATLMLTDNIEDQAKYDATKQRMEIMRKAIVGDSTRTVNGGPEISGFVADMGRLPLCVAELLALGEEITSPPESSPKTYESPCDVDTEITAWSHDASTGIGFGWRGPYIQVSPERSGKIRFRDGYGNSDVDDDIDALNSGWTWQLFNDEDEPVNLPITVTVPLDPLTLPVSIRVQSKGFDDASLYPKGIIDDVDHDKRPVPLIVSSDWQVQLPTTIDVTFKSQNTAERRPDSNVDLVLRIYLHDLNTPEESIESDDFITLAAPSTSSAIPSLPNTQRFTLDSSPSIAIGTRGYSVVCHEDPPVDASEFVIFDGDCDALENPKPSAKNIRLFSVVSRQSLNLTLDWIIQ